MPVPSEVTLRQLEFLLAAVDEGTMAAASDTLGVSPSAVSLGINDLESSVDARLIARSPGQPLALTAVGRHAIGDVRRIVELAANLEERVRAEVTGGGGIVRFGCFPPFSPFYVPDLVTAAADRDAPIDLRVTEAPVEELFDQLLDGRLDMALVYEHAVPESLRREVVHTHYPYVLLPGDHRLAGDAHVSLLDLIDEPMVLMKARRSSYFAEVVDQLGLTPRIARTTNNQGTLHAMVGRGIGWSLSIGFPKSGMSVEGRPIAALPLSDDVEGVAVVVIWPDGVTPTPRVRTVVELCHRFVGRQPAPSAARSSPT